MKKNFLCYSLLFLFFLVWNLIIQPINIDEVWNYGFAHNIYQGLLPYRDFNMVLTPLYPFIMSLPFFIFGSSMLIFHLTQAFLLTITCYFLFRLFQKKAWLILLFFFFPLSFSNPNYNLFLFLLYVVVLFLEEKNGYDFLIGIFIGFIFLTKQSVGVCFLLPTLIYWKNKNQFWKRICGFLIPVSIFFLYLGITNTFADFFNLCILGLFDFAVENGKAFNLFFYLTVIMILFTLSFLRNHPGDIKVYYTLAFYSVIIPLFDLYHFQAGFLAFLLLLLFYQKKEFQFPYRLFVIGVILGVSVVTFVNHVGVSFVYPNSIPRFEYRLLSPSSIEFTQKISNFMKENKNKRFVFLNSDGYYFRLVNDMEIGYLDLINKGNWGYQGSDKLFQAIKKEKDSIFFVNPRELTKDVQMDQRILKYVMTKGKRIKTIGLYDIYIFES